MTKAYQITRSPVFFLFRFSRIQTFLIRVGECSCISCFHARSNRNKWMNFHDKMMTMTMPDEWSYKPYSIGTYLYLFLFWSTKLTSVILIQVQQVAESSQLQLTYWVHCSSESVCLMMPLANYYGKFLERWLVAESFSRHGWNRCGLRYHGGKNYRFGTGACIGVSTQ